MFSRDIPVSHVRQAWQAELAQLEQQVAEAEAQSRQLEEAERLKPLGPLGAAKRGEKVGEWDENYENYEIAKKTTSKLITVFESGSVPIAQSGETPHLGVHMAGSVQFG